MTRPRPAVWARRIFFLGLAGYFVSVATDSDGWLVAGWCCELLAILLYCFKR